MRLSVINHCALSIVDLILLALFVFPPLSALFAASSALLAGVIDNLESVPCTLLDVPYPSLFGFCSFEPTEYLDLIPNFFNLSL